MSYSHAQWCHILDKFGYAESSADGTTLHCNNVHTAPAPAPPAAKLVDIFTGNYHAVKSTKMRKNNNINTNQGVPRNYAEALLTPHFRQWIAAKDSELNSFKKMHTYRTPDIPISEIPEHLIIPSTIQLDIKYNPDGTFNKFKFRLCAKGDVFKKKMAMHAELFSKVYGADSYAGTAKAESIRIILAIAAEKNLELESWDVATAFLHPLLKAGEIIYMRRPHGLTDADMPAIVQLEKCIYGLPQASAYFREHSDAALKSIGLKATKSDSCVYTFNWKGEYLILCAHVDDFGIAASSQSIIEYVRSELSKTYNLTVTPDMTYYLGIHVTRDRPNKKIFLSQPAYIADMMETYNVASIIQSSTAVPLTPMTLDLSYNHSKQLADEPTLPDNQLYMQKIGSLLYLAMHTRPDILFAVTSLSRYCQSPTATHMVAVDRILMYVHATQHLGLTLFSGEGVVLYATVDASYATHKDLKSHTGCTLHIGRVSASIMTYTKKQSITADSSTVAEYIAAHQAAKQIMWARNLLQELGFPQKQPTTLFEDNKSTIRLILSNEGSSGKSKHIDLRYRMINEQVKLKRINMEYLCSEDMISDMLTKTTGPAVFLHLRSKILGSSHEDGEKMGQ